MADDQARIHFISGQHLDVPGTVAEVHGAVLRGRGGLVAMKNLNGDDVVLNPEHVESIDTPPAGP
jgi:hypothetical protein